MDIALVASNPVRVRSGTERGATMAHVKTPSIVAWMLIAMAAVTALAYWDEQRESKAALDDFAEEQVTLAESLAASLGERLKSGVPSKDALLRPPVELLAAVRGIERKGVVRVLLGRPGGSDLVGSDGTIVAAPAIAQALATGQKSLRLSRPQAAGLALPARTAVAGLERVDVGGLGRWGVAVVATAQAERDRELRAAMAPGSWRDGRFGARARVWWVRNA